MEQITQEQAKIVVQELASMPRRKRIWEIDALRGLCMIIVVLDHLMWDIAQLGSYYEGGFAMSLLQFAMEFNNGTNVAGVIFDAIHSGLVMSFVLLSGISCSFSKNNLNRAVKMICVALAFTGVTVLIATVLHSNMFIIYFNVIHVIAISILVYALLDMMFQRISKENIRQIVGIIVGVIVVIMFFVGYYYKGNNCEGRHTWLYPFVDHLYSGSWSPADYLPLLPSLSWFLIGAFVGKKIYKDRQSLFPISNEKIFAPLTVIGRYSLWIYFGSQVVMYGTLYFFAVILGIM